jgi:hypothetical protein
MTSRKLVRHLVRDIRFWAIFMIKMTIRVRIFLFVVFAKLDYTLSVRAVLASDLLFDL